MYTARCALLHEVAAPRTSDGKPDLSELWYPGGERQPYGQKPDAGTPARGA